MGTSTKDLILGTNENDNNGGSAAATPQLPAEAAQTQPADNTPAPVLTGRAARGYEGASEEQIPAAQTQPADNNAPQTAAPMYGADTKPVKKSWAEMYREMMKGSGDEKLTEEERKKKKRELIITSVGDAISALANLYFTGKGALNSYTGKNTSTQQARDRWDKIAKERESKRKEYYDGLFRAQQYDDAKEAADKAEERQAALDKQKAEKEANEQRRKDDIAAAQTELLKARAAGETSKAAYYDAYANARLMGASSEAALNAAKAAAANAKAAKDRASANSINNGGTASGGGRGGKKTYTVYNDQTGEYETFNNESERNKRASELGYDLTPDPVSTSSGYDANTHQKVVTRTQSRSTPAKLGEQERERKQQRNSGKGAGKGAGKGNGKPDFRGFHL